MLWFGCTLLMLILKTQYNAPEIKLFWPGPMRNPNGTVCMYLCNNIRQYVLGLGFVEYSLLKDKNFLSHYMIKSYPTSILSLLLSIY